MDRGMNKIVIVTRKSRLKELIHKYNTREQAKFYIEHMGADFSDYIVEDTNYEKAVATVLEIAEKFARVTVIDRDYVPSMIFGKDDLVIAVGQDGLVANVMKYLDGQLLVGINPDVARWDGVLLPYEPKDLEKVIPNALCKRCLIKQVTLASAKTIDGQEMLAVNDLFIGQSSHTSARYDIIWNESIENQSSSGIIVSTGIGQTGWYKSIIAQLNGAMNRIGKNYEYKNIGWEEERLSFAVREPYPSNTTQVGIVMGFIDKGDTFKIISKMPEKGVVFSDGMEADAIEFNAGMEITIGIAEKKGILVV